METEAEPDWADVLDRVLGADTQPDLVAQPIVDVSSGRITGYELLARFPGPPRATPDVWFAQADRHGRAADHGLVEVPAELVEQVRAAITG